MRTLKMTPEAIKAREAYRRDYADPVKRKHIRELAQALYNKHSEERRQYAKVKYQGDPNYIVSRTNKWRHEHLLQFNAGFAARRFVPLKDHCEICQRTNQKLERMHLDYARPLEVLTACRSCHKKVDRTIKEYGFKESSEPNWDNHHCSNCELVYPGCGRGAPSFKGRGCVLWRPKVLRVVACNNLAESKP